MISRGHVNEDDVKPPQPSGLNNKSNQYDELVLMVHFGKCFLNNAANKERSQCHLVSWFDISTSC